MRRFGGATIYEDKSCLTKVLSNGTTQAQTAGLKEEIETHKAENGK
jgi:hypothetical protein